LTTRNSVRKTSREAINEAEKTLHKANNATAEIVSEQVDKAARATQGQTKDFISSVRAAIDAGSKQLKEDGYGTAANLVDRAVSQTAKAESRVEDVDTAEIANNVQQFIREKPLIAFGGLALAGFVVAAAMQKSNADIER